MIKTENLDKSIYEGIKIHVIDRVRKRTDLITGYVRQIDEYKRKRNEATGRMETASLIVQLDPYVTFMPDKNESYDSNTDPEMYSALNLAFPSIQVTRGLTTHTRAAVPIVKKVCDELTDEFQRYLKRAKELKAVFPL